MSSDERTIGEIVQDAIDEAEANPEEEQLDEARTTVDEGTFKYAASDVAAALSYAIPIAKAREDAHIPPQLSIKDLEGKTFVIASKVRQRAFLPADGTQRDGWQCLCADAETEKPFTVWIGQVTLKKDLELLPLPIRVTLSKRGRTWIFS